MYGIEKALLIEDTTSIKMQCQDRSRTCGDQSTKEMYLMVNYESIKKKGETFFLVIQKIKGKYAVILVQVVRKTKKGNLIEVLSTTSAKYGTIEEAEQSHLWQLFAPKIAPIKAIERKSAPKSTSTTHNFFLWLFREILGPKSHKKRKA
jgi:hypothetical protein